MADNRDRKKEPLVLTILAIVIAVVFIPLWVPMLIWKWLTQSGNPRD